MEVATYGGGPGNRGGESLHPDEFNRKVQDSWNWLEKKLYGWNIRGEVIREVREYALDDAYLDGVYKIFDIASYNSYIRNPKRWFEEVHNAVWNEKRKLKERKWKLFEGRVNLKKLMDKAMDQYNSDIVWLLIGD